MSFQTCQRAPILIRNCLRSLFTIFTIVSSITIICHVVSLVHMVRGFLRESQGGFENHHWEAFVSFISTGIVICFWLIH